MRAIDRWFFGLCSAFLATQSLAQQSDLCAAHLQSSAATVHVIAFLEAMSKFQSTTVLRTFQASFQDESIGEGATIAESLRLRTFLGLLNDPGVDRAAVEAWLQSALDRNETSRKEREAVELETGRLPGAMIFKPVSPNIEFMDTPVTQGMYQKVVGKLPKELSRAKYEKNPHFPINYLVSREVHQFVETLNWAIQKGHLILKELMPDADPSFVVRLPVRKDIDLILDLLRKENDEILRSGDLGLLSRYVWHKENSGGEHLEVGLLEPLKANGHAFFDLLGQREELIWNGDSYSAWGGSVRMEGEKFFQLETQYNSVNPSGEYVLEYSPQVFYSFRLVRERVK